jgi:hypothetical protein
LGRWVPGAAQRVGAQLVDDDEQDVIDKAQLNMNVYGLDSFLLQCLWKKKTHESKHWSNSTSGASKS